MIFNASRSSVSFWHGSTTLQGDLVIPAGPGPHPAAALVAGASGPRDNSTWVDELALCGLLTLSWDSPGWGSSAGPQLWQSPDQRALELLAAVDFLSTRTNIPMSGIGMIAADLGTWAAILAAGLSSRIDAVVLLSPPVTDVMGQEVDRLGRRMRRKGFISAEVDLAQAVLRERIRRLAAGESGLTVYAAEAACRSTPWYQWLPGTTPEEIDAFSSLTRYDPFTMTAMARCPVLAVFGENDLATPAWQSAQRMRQFLDAREIPDHQVVVMPRSGSDRSVVWEVQPQGPRVLDDGPADLVGLVARWVAGRTGRRERPGAWAS